MPRLYPMRLCAPMLAALVMLLAGRASAQVAASPVFHGLLAIRPAVGTIDKRMGIGSLRVKNWDLKLLPDSNGIEPTQDQILIAVGDAERLVLQAGSVKASRNGTRFTYRDPKATRGIRSLRIVQYKNGCIGLACYRVSFSLVQVDVSALLIASPVCTPMAVIIGDDDGFSQVQLVRPNLVGSGYHVRPPCQAGPTCSCPAQGGSWPWEN